MVREQTRAHTNTFMNTYMFWNRNGNWKIACTHTLKSFCHLFMHLEYSAVTKNSKPH